MPHRLCFLSHFLISLACAAGAFFAYQNGVFQSIYANDASKMTSVIAALVVFSAAYIGWQAWMVDDLPVYLGLNSRGERIEGTKLVDTEFGETVFFIAPALGLLGTTVGISLRTAAAANADPTAGFLALSTCLKSTACGVAAMIILIIMTYSLSVGIKRARR